MDPADFKQVLARWTMECDMSAVLPYKRHRMLRNTNTGWVEMACDEDLESGAKTKVE